MTERPNTKKNNDAFEVTTSSLLITLNIGIWDK